MRAAALRAARRALGSPWVRVGSGVGTALMRAGEAWARDRGLSTLSLDVWATNERALTFYRILGYDAESLCLI